MRLFPAVLLLLAGCGTAAAELDTTAPLVPPVTTIAAPSHDGEPAYSNEATVLLPPPTAPTTTVTTIPEAPPVPVVWPGPDTREQVLALPVTDVEKVVFGETVHVVAWYTDDGEPFETFVYERADGTRALVMRNDTLAYITEISPDPCFYDFFNGGTHC